jgi:putative ABC transport system substrate-binding protein
MMRAVLLLAAAGALAVAFAASAQPAGPAPRIAVVLSTSAPAGSPRLAAFQEGLRAAGYVDGKNIRIETHSWAGATRPLPELAAGVMKSGPAVVVAEGNSTIAALKQASATVPIVMSVVGDPVGSGFAASLVRPGANITGLSNTAEQLSSKRLEVLKDILPGLGRVAVLRNPANPTHAIFLRETQSAAQSLGAALLIVDFGAERDLEPAFAAMAREGVHAAVVLPQPLGIVLGRRISELALRNRMPVMFPSPEPVEAGGLVSYGPSHSDLWRRAAAYVDRILKGGNPAELPIQQPVQFDLVLNVKTARALGIAVPAAVRLRTTRAIE